MAKVIIEVKNLQNNDLIGKIVLSKCGRDKDHYYVIVDKVDDEIKASIMLKEKGTDLKIKRFLKLKGIVKEG